LKKLKAGAEDAVITAGIEAAYLQGKKSGFHHPPEVEAQIEVMREVREEIPLLREDVSLILNNEKSLADAETKAAADFTTMAEHKSQHPQLKTIMQLYAAVSTSIASNRYNYHAVTEQIKEEWKTMETVDLKDLRVKQDQTNRAWSTTKYWNKEKKTAKAAEFEARYKVFVSELVHQIHNLREKKEELFPGYILGIIQAEMEFHRKCLEELTKCENTVRNMGRVAPVKFNGYDQFVPLGTSEDRPVGTDEDYGGGGMPNATPPTPMPPPHQPPPASSGPRAKGMFPFQAQSPDELSFQPGDILTIVSQTGDWWTAELNGRQGMIPANYVQMM